MKKDRVFGKAQEFCDLLVCFALFHKIGHSDFHGGKFKCPGGQSADERGYNIGKVGLKYVDQGPLIGVQTTLLQPVEVRPDQFLDIG